ncbi:hypothetical protein LSF60_23685 (plasmid) [Rhodococcus pyridinivorans]|uniref:hypothetical protein n=1 Tax=Rhodococcus pyridinivorans TaxID=103816 RepID=UPI001E40645E|nr:hypothetical protein [Rhodococcus pyridinivorans]UGQ60485.1 hypothetical protein LSF60_23685 [Rhodococcus pyridinivorans]
MNKKEITAKLHNLGRDIDALLENISTGKDISVVLAESRDAKAAARAAGMTEGAISAAVESGLS